MTDDIHDMPTGAGLPGDADFDIEIRESFESVLDRFEAAWQSGEPDIAEYAAARPGDDALVVELCLVDQEHRRNRGLPASLEPYIARFPAVADRLRNLAAISLADAAARGGRAVSDLVGREIGDVTIVRLIGEGGMGRVYEGRQRKPRRPVAVKVMQPGVASPALLKRFEYEAQVLARLQHPGIAHIYAIGTHEVDGQAVPYFVMEYIPNAKTLTQYAEEQKLSTHERLELFQKVCDAVAHGHQKGVIHRDLKPANVVVDSTGQPKVIDFGVAKATDSDLALTTMQTDVGAIIGTLQYMSPEQFDADPDDLDVRLDVYALGVVLYELLTGKPPYDVKRKAIYEVARVVREEEPTPITSLDRTLRRDVAVIAGKCLEKDRDRRYSSAAELAGDVGRYLAGEPITAAPPSLWDGVARLARRHKAAAAAVVGVAASLVAAVVGISAFAVRAERARVEANVQRDAATRARMAEAEQRQLTEQSLVAVREQSKEAKRRLYASTLYRLNDALGGGTQGLAKDLFRSAAEIFADLTDASAPEPLELRVLRPLLDDSIAVLEGHDDRVTSVVFSPNGTWLATGSDDHTARIWDRESGTSLLILAGHTAAVTSVAFSPDGHRLATASGDGTARIWDAHTGELLSVVNGHTAPVTSVVFSPDGTRLATASDDNTAHIWDAADGTVITVVRGHQNAVRSVAFDADGTRLVTASWDGTVRIWDATSGGPLGVIETVSAVQSAVFSPGGDRVATSAWGGCSVWDAHDTAQRVAAFGGHTHDVMCVAFGPGGNRLATASEDNTARVWDAATGACVAVLKGHDGRVTSVAFSPDGAWLATASDDHTVRMWDAAEGGHLSVLQGSWLGLGSAALFSADGSRIVTHQGIGAAVVWDAATCEPLAGLELHEQWPVVTFSPDGTRLAAMGKDAAVRVWDAVTGLPIVVLSHPAVPPEESTACFTFSPHGTRLATQSTNGSVGVWDTTTGKRLFTLDDQKFSSVCVSPDDTRLAATSGVSNINPAILSDAVTGEIIATFPDVSDAIFGPDSARLATAANDGSVCLRNALTGESLGVIEGHGSRVTSMAFSLDGGRLAIATADNVVRIWETRSCTMLAEAKGHTHFVVSLAFSPDGTRLATSSHDGTSRIWDAASGELYAVLEEPDAVQSIFIGPSGDCVATSGHQRVRFWGLSNADIHANRRAAKARREKLGPLVDEWFTGDLAAVKAKLEAAKATMSADDWRAAANLVLMRAMRADPQQPAGSAVP